MANYLIKDTTLSNIANSIRNKTGSTEKIKVADMANEISGISAGGVDTSDATATASDILGGKTAYVDGEKITGTIATKTSSNLTTSGATVTVPAGYYATQATKSVASGSAKTPATTVTKNPTISVNSSGLIIASVSGTQNVTPTVSAGYVSSGTAGTITVSGSATYQLAFQAAKTITPGTTDQTAVSANTYTGGAVTVKGDSNLVAANIVSGKSIFGVVGTATTGGGGDTDAEDGLITRQLTSYTNDRVTSIGGHAFYSCTSLTTASFPACRSIGSYAFAHCTSLTTVNFPACTSIGSYVFSGCTSLTTVSFPVCTIIDRQAFYGCSRLTTASFPVCRYIGGYAFYGCSRLTTASFPVCTSIVDHAFYSCTSLTTVSFPVCTSIGSYVFAYCSRLTTASFPVCTSIGSYLFNKCYNLSQLTLGSSRVCTLANSNAFSSTPFAGYSASFSGTPVIYVTASLVNAYKTATNWTYFSKYIQAIK